jgi:nicotinamide phosphoribosyltransferase
MTSKIDLDFNNIIYLTDSYKPSHYLQYPADSEYVYSYLESRGGWFEDDVFVLLQLILHKYLAGVVVTQEKIDEAEELLSLHLPNVKFNREGWEYILKVHKGKLPIQIKAVPEGTVVRGKNVLMTVVNTDPKCFWLTNYLESLLLHVWYPITVATLSREMKKTIGQGVLETGDI